MRTEPMPPDSRSMDQALTLRRDATGVEQEAFVATLLGVPEAKRSAFTHGIARTAGRNAAIESTALSVATAALAPGELHAAKDDPEAHRLYVLGWNARQKRLTEDLGRLRGALVASRRKGHATVAKPETLLADGTVAELLYRLWTLVDLDHACEWEEGTGKCLTHPYYSSDGECDHALALETLARLELDPKTDQIPDLWDEAKARRAHAQELAAELPEEGDASAAQQ